MLLMTLDDLVLLSGARFTRPSELCVVTCKMCPCGGRSGKMLFGLAKQSRPNMQGRNDGTGCKYRVKEIIVAITRHAGAQWSAKGTSSESEGILVGLEVEAYQEGSLRGRSR